MTATTTHRLEGLEPDNLLAFLALLGLLRALETGAPDWRPRVHWTGPPLRPVLTLAAAATQEEIAKKTAEGCAELAKDYEFGGRELLDYTQDELRSLHEAAWTRGRVHWECQSAIMAPLAHESALKDDQKKKNGALERSPFNCLDVAKVKFLRNMSIATGNAADFPTKISNAIFLPWKRQDRFTTFRWDPAEDRRYAYRDIEPGPDKVKTEAGAIRLAAIGLALMPGAATERRGKIKLMVIGSRQTGEGEIEISWPVWDVQASRCGLQALLAHPELVRDKPDMPLLRRLNIVGVFRARKISVGKYGNFTRAEAL